MVEQGEELAKIKGITGLYKWLVSYMVSLIIKKSISSGMRTKEDWVAFRKQQKAIEENNLVEWSIEDEEDIEETETEDTDSLPWWNRERTWPKEKVLPDYTNGLFPTWSGSSSRRASAAA